MRLRILIRGSNDIGSAVAHTLFQAGYAVAIHDNPKPTVTRRKMAFTNAIFDGHTTLEGVKAYLVNRNFLLRGMLAHHKVIPLSVGIFDEINEIVRPQILIDARMRKHEIPAKQLGLAPLTIGIGPNFVAGSITDLAIETSWGDHLGRVLHHGATLALKGEPREIGGHARDRYIYAPCSGVFHTSFQPGDPVQEGQKIAQINETLLFAPITGILRGITHDNIPVRTRTKVIEVDPRGEHSQISGIAMRPKKIATGILYAIRIWEKHHAN